MHGTNECVHVKNKNKKNKSKTCHIIYHLISKHHLPEVSTVSSQSTGPISSTSARDTACRSSWQPFPSASRRESIGRCRGTSPNGRATASENTHTNEQIHGTFIPGLQREKRVSHFFPFSSIQSTKAWVHWTVPWHFTKRASCSERKKTHTQKNKSMSRKKSFIFN